MRNTKRQQNPSPFPISRPTQDMTDATSLSPVTNDSHTEPVVHKSRLTYAPNGACYRKFRLSVAGLCPGGSPARREEEEAMSGPSAAELHRIATRIRLHATRMISIQGFGYLGQALS